MESKVNRKRKFCEEVEAGGSGKIAGENVGKKVDPGGDCVPKLKDPKGQMGEQTKVGRSSPVKLKGKSEVKNLSKCKSKGSQAKNDIPPHHDVDNPGLDSLEQVEVVIEDVVEISSDDDETGEVVKISSDENETGEVIKKELVEFLKAQISAMSLDLECPVCLNVCEPPIYSCLAQHPVCSRCRPDLKQCAVCRESYDQGLIRHRYAERDYEKLEEVRHQLSTLHDSKI